MVAITIFRDKGAHGDAVGTIEIIQQKEPQLRIVNIQQNSAGSSFDEEWYRATFPLYCLHNFFIQEYSRVLVVRGNGIGIQILFPKLSGQPS